MLLLISNAAICQAWELRQVKVKHVQFGNDGAMYITVYSDTASASGCLSNNGWARMDLSDPTVSLTKQYIASLAITAFTTKTPVDIGSIVNGCVSGYANLTSMRLGDYKQ